MRDAVGRVLSGRRLARRAGAPRLAGISGPAVRFCIAGSRFALAKMAATAFLGGVAEALFLITVTRAAFAVTDRSDRVGIVSGWFLSVDQTLLVALGFVAVRIVLGVWASWQSAQLGSGVVARVRRLLTDAFLEASWPVQQQQRGGSLQELLTTYSGHSSALITGVCQSVVASANLTALLGMAVAVDPVGAGVLVVAVGVLGSLLRPLRRVVRRRSREAARAGMSFATSVSEVADLGMELHVFHVQDQARDRLARVIERSRDETMRLSFATGLATPLYMGLAYASILGALAIIASSSTTSFTSLGAAMLVMLRSLSYGQVLQASLTNISSSSSPIDELRERLALLEQGRRADGGQPIGPVSTVDVEHVSFAYVNGDDVLRDVSFSVRPREVVGIVGPSGGGKSTLVQLLLGLRDPDRGRVLVSGRDLATVDRAELSRRVTFVPQTPRLIDGSIADNVRFLRPGVSQDAVEAATRLAALHEEIVSMPGGYERLVGGEHGTLSGGQAQRLCIARALVEEPDVVILDEPTSALDVRSEHLIGTALLRLRERMTVIVIAHRLSTVEICDRIMVIQNGQLRGFDTPSALEASNEFYREALILSGMR